MNNATRDEGSTLRGPTQIKTPCDTSPVATLALGLRPRQGLTKVWAKNQAWESHFMFLGVWESVRE